MVPDPIVLNWCRAISSGKAGFEQNERPGADIGRYAPVQTGGTAGAAADGLAIAVRGIVDWVAAQAASLPARVAPNRDLASPTPTVTKYRSSHFVVTLLY